MPDSETEENSPSFRKDEVQPKQAYSRKRRSVWMWLFAIIALMIVFFVNFRLKEHAAQPGAIAFRQQNPTLQDSTPSSADTRRGTEPLLSQPSWLNLSYYTGDSGSKPISPVNHKQLAYELQNYQDQHFATSNSVQQKPYDAISESRNNLRGHVPISLLYWNRKTSIAKKSATTGMDPTVKTPAEAVQTNITVFSFAPVRPETYRGSDVTLSLAAGDLFEEAIPEEKTIQTVQIDPGDGGGYRSLSLDQEIPVSYTTTGTKSMTLQATLTDGTVLTALSMLEVTALSTPNPTTTVRLTAPYPYNNTTGTVYIYKSDNHVGLRFPVLVAEGFDMENSMDWDVLYNILNKENLAETLRSYGRDLIVLDYTNAMRNIFDNAALARSAINYVNANRYNPSDKFTVIGASMGGLVTRIALTQMDRTPATYGQSHVNTWISFDSPHMGANIPLGLQEFFAFFNGKTGIPAVINNYYALLNQPAARQMLLVHHFQTGLLAGNPTNIVFQSTLQTLGYPTTCKKIAISNGSGIGWQQSFSAGGQIINWDNAGWFLADVACRIYAISTTSTPAQTIFWGFHDTLAWFDETSLTRYHYYPYSIDNAPGGYRNSFRELYTKIQESGEGGSGDFCNADDHCFIPTVSSLGLDIAYCSYSLNYYSWIKAQSPFDEIHYPYYNEPHIDINTNNKRWFMRAILEDYDTDGDGLDDYNEYLAGTAYTIAEGRKNIVPSFKAHHDTTNVELSVNGQPNTLYRVYHAETLTGEWSLIDSSYIPYPATLYYPKDTSKPSGFYKITTEIIDPVTD